MSASSGHGSEPNLTPILDMVFQLITFFMLVINFKGASLDLSLKLPVLGSARPLDTKGGPEPLLLNIDTQGRVKMLGTPVDLEQALAKEARYRERTGGAKKGEEESNTPVIIRADRLVPFHLLNETIKTCQKHGFRHYQLSAMTREEAQ